MVVVVYDDNDSLKKLKRIPRILECYKFIVLIFVFMYLHVWKVYKIV